MDLKQIVHNIWKDIVEQNEETLKNYFTNCATINWHNSNTSFHATSFFEFDNDKITMLNEYWGDDCKAPQWRKDKNIGRPISI